MIPQSTTKNNHNIIECVVITLTMGRHVPANRCVLALRTSVTVVTLLVLFHPRAKSDLIFKSPVVRGNISHHKYSGAVAVRNIHKWLYSS